MKEPNVFRCKPMTFVPLAALLLLFVNIANGQIGVTICACQPGTYTFRINYTSLCPDTNVLDNAGVRGVDCFQRGYGTNSESINDTVPVQINSINVLELNENGTSALAVTPFNGVFQDGSTFVYTSPLLGSIESVSKLTPDTMPGGLQIDLIGINRFEQPITNVWIILFINDCTYFPILNINDNIGWTTLIDLEQPFDSVCPLSVTPPLASTFPTSKPTNSPGALSTIPTSAPIVSNVPTPKPSIRCIPRSKSATEEGDSNGSGSSNGKGGRIKKPKGNGSKSGGSGKGSGNGKGGGGKGKNETSKGKERATDGIGATDISSADDEDMTLQASRGVGNRLPYCDEVVTKIAKKQITNDQSSKTPSSSKKLTKQSSSKQSSSKGNGSKGSGMNDSNNSVDVKSKKNKKEYDESRKHGKVHKVIRSVGHEQPLIMDTKHSSTKGSTKETKSRGSHFHYEKKERCDSRKKAKIHQGKRTRQSPDANLSLEMQSRTVSHEKTEFQYNKKTKSKVGGHGKLRAKNEGRNHAKNGIIFPPTASPPSTSPGSADDGIAIKQKHVYERGNDRPNQKIVSKGHKHEKNRGNDRSDTEDNMATSLLQSEGRGRDRSNIMN